MITTRLFYHRPRDLQQACEIMNEHALEAAVLGGGTMLLPRMNRNEVQVNHVVDLRGLGLDKIEVHDDRVKLGAMVTYSDVLASSALEEAVPLLQQVSRGITGGNQIRNQGTLAGSACYANPSSEVPAVLAALKARLQLSSVNGVREVEALDFFFDAFRADIQPGEFVSSIVVPRKRLRTGYYKLKISAGSWPIATAVAVFNNETGEKSVTLGAVERRPLRIDLTSVMDGKMGLPAAEVSKLVRERVTDPWSDVLAPGEYRRKVADVVARRAIENLLEKEAAKR